MSDHDSEDEGMYLEGETDELPYDPDQDREEKRKLRRSYRTLHDDEDLRNPNSIEVGQLSEKVKAANNLFQKVKGPQEATLDSSFLLKASNLGAAKARLMRANVSGFDVDDFVSRLIIFMGGHIQRPGRRSRDPDDEDDDDDEGGPLDWEKIGRKALAKSRRIPAMDFMLGPLSVEQKKRAQTKRARFEKDKEEERRPQEIKEDDIQKSGNETSNNVASLEKILENFTEETNLFRFIVNPESFGQSVENLFYLSFLIRDGRVALDIKDGEPIIFLAEPPNEADYENGVTKKQMIMELDFETWKEAIKVFDIKKPTIPTRKAAATKIGAKWYG